jgi:hypothetical protein
MLSRKWASVSPWNKAIDLMLLPSPNLQKLPTGSNITTTA